MKYFLLGAFASAFFLYGAGAALRLRRTRSTCRRSQRRGTLGQADVLLYVGLALLLVGLLFKAGIAPFHSWTPDVYQGSPTPVTAFMASCTKVAAFGAILRVLYVGFGPTVGLATARSGRWPSRRWRSASIFALTQTDIKRVLAYSSIAHAGFILVGVWR